MWNHLDRKFQLDQRAVVSSKGPKFIGTIVKVPDDGAGKAIFLVNLDDELIHDGLYFARQEELKHP
jgi:hypothetical protein